jgi:hypothetical protein
MLSLTGRALLLVGHRALFALMFHLEMRSGAALKERGIIHNICIALSMTL